MIEEQYLKLHLLSSSEALGLIDERIRYKSTPPILLAFFLNQKATQKITNDHLSGFWPDSKLGSQTQAEYTLKVAVKYLSELLSSASETFRSTVLQEFRDFQVFCKSSKQQLTENDEDAYITSHFPLLSSMRKRLMAAPAVSSTSERAFSLVRRIETTDRNRLSQK